MTEAPQTKHEHFARLLDDIADKKPVFRCAKAAVRAERTQAVPPCGP
ncbi:hypothetical protein ACFOZ0_29635 [Streptomyces yaanensis]|uniref:Uncharacterized protein n=1 Tax=Streptomyces yaanensis TaxID=1142239 RepID=A0ABV7SLN7_9ACTN|nr:hypothetical protein [Streptomyces sp. CGMCC 4.7035]WNC00950.1 hypothetical protein Q2K21_24450 [Streptomyces sp. CGMCC 4.7035]